MPVEVGATYTHDTWSQRLMTISDFIASFVAPRGRFISV